MAHELMDEEEANAIMDRWFTEKFGKTYRQDDSPPPAKEPDSLQKILKDYPLLFGEGPTGTA